MRNVVPLRSIISFDLSINESQTNPSLTKYERQRTRVRKAPLLRSDVRLQVVPLRVRFDRFTGRIRTLYRSAYFLVSAVTECCSTMWLESVH